MDIAVRIASAQLQGLSRSHRQVLAPPLMGLLHESDTWFLSTMVASDPGKPFDPDVVPAALEEVRGAFAEAGRWLGAELVEEASPGLADLLAENGMIVKSRPPLLAVEPAGLSEIEAPAEITVTVVASPADQVESDRIGGLAFGMEGLSQPFKDDPVEGGSVLVHWEGVPVARAAWTAVADGVTEVAGVGTIPEYRRRGLGALATAAATRAAFEHAGATLAWLTPGDDGADRIYRRIGFKPAATAVHLGDPGGHLADLQ